MLSISINHPDIEEFILVKQDLTKVTGANMSVKVTNEFMEAVENNEDYILTYPINQRLKPSDVEEYKEYNKLYPNPYGPGFFKRIKALELWNKLIHCAWNTAEPGIIFEDHHNNYSPDSVYEDYKFISTNPCGEIAMQPYDSCRLIHHNFTSFIIGELYTDSAKINWELAYNQFYIGMILGDILIDLEDQAIQKIIAKINLDNDILPENKKVELELWNKIIESAQSTRRTGIGFTALADMLAMLNLSYGSKESLEIVDKLMYLKQKAELNATIDLALMYGPFKGYDEYKEHNLFFDHIKLTFPEEYTRMLQFGRRNLSFSTVAPTGSISILTQTSSGIEPVFLPFYQRKRKITNENDKVDFIDKVGVKYTTYNVIHKPLIDWIMVVKQVPMEDLLQMPVEKLQELFKDSPWYKNCASDINYIDRLKMQSVIQKYTTHSISSTLNLPKETKDSVIDNIYREAYKLNLKGVTIYRDGSRDGILTSINTKPTSTAFLETKAPKRPTSLPAKLDIVTIKGQPFAIIVGLYENKPYEVFAFKLTDPSIKECTGIIKKKAKKVYDFSSEGIYIPNLELSYESIEEKAFTLYTSMSLRHGVNIKYIIKTLNKVDENITSFAKALNRVLSKYIPKETTDELCPECGNPLVREAGCIKCLHCSYSRC